MSEVPLARRYCPVCTAETGERVCADDGTTTLLVDAPASDPSRITAGYILADRYQIDHELGRGGFGAVFAARHTGTGQAVGVKVLAAGADDVNVQRFFREARVTAGLQHPNTIRVFDFGQADDGTLFIAMELLIGVSVADKLRARLREQAVFSEREALELGIAVVQSLAEAHGSGLVHRDLKPQNIFIHTDAFGQDVVKVLDFGIAKGQGHSLTGGGVLGTPTYMSPEQAQGADCDGRSDLYSLGVMLFHLVCGEPPFAGDQPLQVLMAHVSREPPDIATSARTRISPAFAALVRRAMCKRAADRFADADAMHSALHECLLDIADAGSVPARRGSNTRLAAPPNPVRKTSGSYRVDVDGASTAVSDPASGETMAATPQGAATPVPPMRPAPAATKAAGRSGPDLPRRSRSPWVFAAVGVGLAALTIGALVLVVTMAKAPESVRAAPMGLGSAGSVTEAPPVKEPSAPRAPVAAPSVAEPDAQGSDQADATDTAPSGADAGGHADHPDAVQGAASEPAAAPAKPARTRSPRRSATRRPAKTKPRVRTVLPTRRAAPKGPARRPAIDDALEVEVE